MIVMEIESFSPDVVSPPIISIFHFLHSFLKVSESFFNSFLEKFDGSTTPIKAYFGVAFMAMASEIFISKLFFAIFSRLIHSLLK